jgi:hypothetical protein
MTKRRRAYKKAATKAPKPRTLPAATLTLAAAPWEFWAPLVPVAEPLWRAPEPDAPDPDAMGVEVWIWTVVLLLALTTTVRVLLNMEPVPGRTRVWTPGPTAGISAGAGWAVTTAGCEVTAAGWLGMLVTAAGWVGIPVTTPRELVCLRKDVWG